MGKMLAAPRFSFLFSGASSPLKLSRKKGTVPAWDFLDGSHRSSRQEEDVGHGASCFVSRESRITRWIYLTFFPHSAIRHGKYSTSCGIPRSMSLPANVRAPNQRYARFLSQSYQYRSLKPFRATTIRQTSWNGLSKFSEHRRQQVSTFFFLLPRIQFLEDASLCNKQYSS